MLFLCFFYTLTPNKEVILKILYVSDLDGTLLNSNNTISEYSINTINGLINKGMCFSYATARSLSSASVVTHGLKTNIPVITYNGTFIVNANTKEKLFSLCFSDNEKTIITDFLDNNSVFPFVNSFIDGEEKVSWVRNKENDGMKKYLNSRKGDIRLRPVDNKNDLYNGELFYFTCIGEKQDLEKAYNYFGNSEFFTCTLQQELYQNEYWCEVMSKNATKGNAVIALKEMLKCDKIISFGDAINDIPMFKISNECYAVENAVDELKKHATGIIKSNDNDGVAHWLEMNYGK